MLTKIPSIIQNAVILLRHNHTSDTRAHLTLKYPSPNFEKQKLNFQQQILHTPITYSLLHLQTTLYACRSQLYVLNNTQSTQLARLNENI